MHIPKPSWIHIRRGIPQGIESNFVRIDHVWVDHGDESSAYRLNGSIICVCRNSHRMWRTIYGRTIRDGVRPIWLLERNGLGGLLTRKGRKAAAA